MQISFSAINSESGIVPSSFGMLINMNVTEKIFGSENGFV
jgi:hypothetical protein